MCQFKDSTSTGGSTSKPTVIQYSKMVILQDIPQQMAKAVHGYKKDVKIEEDDEVFILVQHQRLNGHVHLAITVLIELSWKLISLQECIAQEQGTPNHLVTAVLATIASLRLPLLHPLMVLMEDKCSAGVYCPSGSSLKFLCQPGSYIW